MGNITDLESLNEYYRQLDKEKLQITLTMASPLLIPKHFLHFDAILTDLVARRFFGHENERWYDFSLHKEVPLPLAEFGECRKVWCSSIAYTKGEMKNYESMWTRKGYDKYAGSSKTGVVWGKGVLADKQIKVNKTIKFEEDFIPTNPRESGAHRSFFETHKVNRSKEIIFFVNGNKEAIETLLENLHFIGKKRSVGFGQIAEINVESIDVDYSLVDMNGYPSRVIPLSEIDNLNINEQKKIINFNTYKPSYANPDNRILCVTPKSNLPHIHESEFIEELEDEFDEDIYFI